MAPRLNSSTIIGVGIQPLRMSFQFYMVLLALRMLLLRLVEFPRSAIQWNVCFTRAAHD
jgi:hypothetical protein